MDNRGKAGEIIAPWIEKEWGLPEDNAESAAEDLAAAGVLADDLPAPDEGEWEVGWNVISLDGMYVLPMIESDALTPDEARDLALALLAAAAHAQKEEANE